jgi:hypothetical protein
MGKNIGEAWQNGNGKKAKYKQLLLSFVLTAMVHQIQKGYHQKQACVHAQIPGIAIGCKVADSAQYFLDAGKAMLIEILQK